MSFQVHNNLKEFFDFDGKRVFSKKGQVSVADQDFILFDAYYASLLVGLKRKKKGSEVDLEKGHFIDHFPSPFSASREYIVGLLIESETRHLEGEDYSKHDIERNIVKLLSFNSPTRLSKDGIKSANLYACHGFEVIQETFEFPPSSVPNFLIKYNQYWAEGTF